MRANDKVIYLHGKQFYKVWELWYVKMDTLDMIEHDIEVNGYQPNG